MTLAPTDIEFGIGRAGLREAGDCARLSRPEAGEFGHQTLPNPRRGSPFAFRTNNGLLGGQAVAELCPVSEGGDSARRQAH